MADPLTPQVSDRICQHMNEDHSDAVLLYAQTYGETPQAEAATLQSIDNDGMNLLATIKGQLVPLRIPFDHSLQDSEDAHHTLIAMLKQVQSPS